MHFRRGNCNEYLGQINQAIAEYEYLIHSFANTDYAYISKTRLQALIPVQTHTISVNPNETIETGSKSMNNQDNIKKPYQEI